MKTTILLGAGASAKNGALPVVANFGKALEEIRDYFINFECDQGKEIDFGGVAHFKLGKAKEEIVERFTWVIENERNHSSIDTFAKKLFIQGGRRSDLLTLKHVLSVFLEVYQSLHKPDPRYDFFFAAALGRDKRLPSNLDILSWNYDTQLERAFSAYTGYPNLISNSETLGVSLRGHEDVNLQTKNCRIIKINGQSGMYSNFGDSFYPVVPHVRSDSEIDLEEVISLFYGSILINTESNISFAWEDPEGSALLKSSARIMQETEILVVIGYSFPYFNREIDSLILKNPMMLRRVYVQDPKKANDIIAKIKQTIPEDFLSSIEFIPVTDCDEFHIPREL